MSATGFLIIRRVQSGWARTSYRACVSGSLMLMLSDSGVLPVPLLAGAVTVVLAVQSNGLQAAAQPDVVVTQHNVQHIVTSLVYSTTGTVWNIDIIVQTESALDTLLILEFCSPVPVCLFLLALFYLVTTYYYIYSREEAGSFPGLDTSGPGQTTEETVSCHNFPPSLYQTHTNNLVMSG